MAPRGSIYPLTVGQGDLVVPYFPWLQKQLRLIGSVIAGRQIQRDMLEFAAEHDVKAIIEEFPLTAEGLEASFAKLEAGRMRYRGVLVAQ